MFRLFRYLRGYVKESVVGPLFKMLEACFELFVPIVMANMIDVGIKNSDTGYIWRQCALLISLGVLGFACSITAQYYAAKASMGLGTALREELFSHMNRLSYTELDQIGTPTLVTRITSDVNQVQTSVNLLLRLFLRSPFLVVGAVVMAYMISHKLTVIFLIAVPLIGLSIFAIVRVTIPIYRRAQESLDRVMRQTRENYTGARVVRAFSRQKEEMAAFSETSLELRKIQMNAGRISALMNPITYVLVNLAIIAILMQSGREVDRGFLSQGEVIALVNYMNQILIALVALANLIITVTRGWASAGRINEIFDTCPSMTDDGNKEQFTEKSAPAVSFEKVSFTYARDKAPSLCQISFCADQGETIGVIGGTGSGKTTLINLIPRFYDASEGKVLVMGHETKEYPFWQLRKMIGIVPQKAVLFAGTIRENMCWRKPDATDEEIWEALSIAQAREFVESKPDGLKEHVAAGGRNFSGGQRQRLTIARALVGSPKILILDDSASALDYATDAALRKAIRENTKGCTVFLVSQRASAVRHADQILVLEDGTLAGTGTHEELLENCRVYREICQSQFSGEEVETSE
ncbi:MAG: ABC transporter ATP-binding protein/permease [Fusicatenibacter sp.]|nr:ABC transporter ATP-binding protein/permease [Fusicatenibacter sp.]